MATIEKDRGNEGRGTSAAERALGAMETNSVAAGIHGSDEAVKASGARLLVSTAVCAGKYFFCVTGTAAAVRASLDAARGAARGFVFAEFWLARCHEDVLPSMLDVLPVQAPGALGIIESYSAIAAIELADRIAKGYPCRLRETAVARGLGGKSFVAFTGGEEAVRLAADEGAALLAERGLLVNRSVLERPALVPPLVSACAGAGPGCS